jgi:hypothetical protein
MSGRRHRTLPVIRLLARLAWQRDPQRWTVVCRDGRGRRATLRISLAGTGAVVAPSSAGPFTLTPLQVGRLRGALRDVVVTHGQLTADQPGANGFPVTSGAHQRESRYAS